MTTLVTIASFTLVPEAELLKGKLKDAGIHAFIFKDDCGGMHPHMQLTGGVQLKVPLTDYEAARDILSPTAEHLEPSEEEIYLCKIRNLIYRSKGWILLGHTIIWGFVSFPISFSYATKAMRLYKLKHVKDIALKSRIFRMQVAAASFTILFWLALIYYFMIEASTAVKNIL